MSFYKIRYVHVIKNNFTYSIPPYNTGNYDSKKILQFDIAVPVAILFLQFVRIVAR